MVPSRRERCGGTTSGLPAAARRRRNRAWRQAGEHTLLRPLGTKRQRRQAGQSIVTLSLRDGVIVDGSIKLVLFWNGGLGDQASQSRHGDELVLRWEQFPEERFRRRRLSAVPRQLPAVYGHLPGCWFAHPPARPDPGD